MIKAHIPLLSFILFCLVSPKAHAATGAYYKCSYKEGGVWGYYGRLPEVRAANSFGSDSVLIKDYLDLIFNDSVSRTPERDRYVSEMHALTRDAANYYIRKRKPSASTEEIKQFILAIQATAAHETRMSHYRKTTDNRYKLMRGDFAHGHGLMQIDDRPHFNAINNGIAWRLITNLTYAMDIYFEEWERAPFQSCYKNASDKWKARIRSAWAAYNGGSGSICRWTNPNSVYADNDRNFLDMLNSQSWRTYVDNPYAPASVDVACLIENKENCGAPGAEDDLVSGKLYQLPSRSVCAYLGGQFKCVSESRDAICLKALGSVDVNTVTPIDSIVAGSIPATLQDRHSLCQKYDSSLIPVGAKIKTEVQINLRSTPGGGLLQTLAAGQNYQVLDFEIRNSPINDRYYQVQVGATKGYIYAGDHGDHAAWVTEITSMSSAPTLSASVIPSGLNLSIVTRSGINQRTTPGGDLIRAISVGTKLTVLDVVVKGSNNEIYYKVNHLGRVGYIYSGTLLPADTTMQWTKRAP